MDGILSLPREHAGQRIVRQRQVITRVHADLSHIVVSVLYFIPTDQPREQILKTWRPDIPGPSDPLHLRY